MKHINAILITLLLTLAFGSCEKPIIEDEEDKTENNTDKKDNNTGNKGDNGGWNNGDEDEVNNEEWQNGDTVNVAKFINNDFANAIWVKGYIVGCANGAKGVKYDFDAPYQYNTAVLIADNPKTTNLKYIVSIQLGSGTKMRKLVNLKDNPDNAGRIIAVYGFKQTYLNLPGIKSPGAWDFK